MGAGEEQIATARRECHIAGLAGDLVLAEGAALTAGDLAARAGVDVDAVLSLWRTLGVVVPDEQRPMFSERDADFTSFVIKFKPVGLRGDELFRVLGSSLARVAEAAVSLYVQTVEPQMDLPETDMLIWAQDLAEATAMALRSATRWGRSSPITCATPSTVSGPRRPR